MPELDERHTAGVDRDIPADMHDFGFLDAGAGCIEGDLGDPPVPVD